MLRVSQFIYSYAECRYAERLDAKKYTNGKINNDLKIKKDPSLL
jgi:hypothetical protein